MAASLSLRNDDRAGIEARLQRSRPELLTADWEQRAALVEQMLALAAWRNGRGLGERTNALIDALDIFRGPVTYPVTFKPWGSDEL